MIHHEIFTARSQPELNEKTFTPSEEQLTFARKALQQKRKISFGNQQILFCRRDEGQLMTINEKVLEGARKKYLDFIKKNYNQKLSEELFNINLLKKKIREMENRKRDQAAKDQEDTVGKKVEPAKKRGKEPKAVAGKKKVKEQPAAKEGKANGKKGKKQASSAMPQLPQLQVAGELQDAPSEIDSGELNLINSLSGQQFDGGDYDE